MRPSRSSRMSVLPLDALRISSSTPRQAAPRLAHAARLRRVTLPQNHGAERTRARDSPNRLARNTHIFAPRREEPRGSPTARPFHRQVLQRRSGEGANFWRTLWFFREHAAKWQQRLASPRLRGLVAEATTTLSWEAVPRTPPVKPVANLRCEIRSVGPACESGQSARVRHDRSWPTRTRAVGAGPVRHAARRERAVIEPRARPRLDQADRQQNQAR